MKKLILILLFTFSVATAASADNLSKYNAYAKKYDKLEESCRHILKTRTDDAPIRYRNCVWDKDKMLLAEYRFGKYFNDLAYQRYTAHFNAAKDAARARIWGKDWVGPWAEAVVHIDDSYYRILKQEALQ